MTKKSAARIGRPLKLTPEVAHAYCSAIAIGATKALAAAHAGVHPETIGNWLRLGAEAALGPYFEFFELQRRAETVSALRSLKHIDTAAARDWRAAAWQLEKRFPADYGKRSLEITGDPNAPIEHIIKVVREPLRLPNHEVDPDGDPVVTEHRFFRPRGDK